jgi:putative FmdB family regulatory protein
MPIYEYKPKLRSDCSFCSQGFEIISKISDSKLLVCPECGADVERVISAPSLAKSSPPMDKANLEKHGFTQYKKAEKGVYEKTAGKGPDVITGD